MRATPKFVYYLSAEYMPGRHLAAERAVYRHCRDGPPGRCRSGYSAGELENPTWSRGWGTAGWAGWPPACWTP